MFELNKFCCVRQTLQRETYEYFNLLDIRIYISCSMRKKQYLLAGFPILNTCQRKKKQKKNGKRQHLFVYWKDSLDN